MEGRKNILLLQLNPRKWIRKSNRPVSEHKIFLEVSVENLWEKCEDLSCFRVWQIMSVRRRASIAGLDFKNNFPNSSGRIWLLKNQSWFKIQISKIPYQISLYQIWMGIENSCKWQNLYFEVFQIVSNPFQEMGLGGEWAWLPWGLTSMAELRIRVRPPAEEVEVAGW